MSSTSPLPLSTSGIDRDDASRANPELWADIRADPRALLLVLVDSRVAVVNDHRQGYRLHWLPVTPEVDSAHAVYLGRGIDPQRPETLGAPLVAIVQQPAGTQPQVAALSEIAPGESAWMSLRDFARDLDSFDVGAVTQAQAILNWRASHPFSPRNGHPTLAQHGGWVLSDAHEGVELFPRTDAAVIVAVTDEHNRILMGSNASWAHNRFSLLAGFVEPGESLEQAATREVFEESGVRIVNPRYFGSQPWPFPASLMIGFFAQVQGDIHERELQADGEEIAELRWFDHVQIADPNRSVVLPGSTSIARAMLEHWFGGPIPEGENAW